MPYKMSEQQFRAVDSLPDLDRYNHFISKVADWKEVWGVRTEEGWLLPITPEGVAYFPLWPHPEYAERVASKNWPGNHAEELDYKFLMSEGLEQLSKDGVKIAVFPNLTWQCVVADALQVRQDLFLESGKYE